MNAPGSEARRPIRLLDEGTVRRIAAGEVVERPASVVKELVENSIDAGASGVTVRIEGGGLERIEIADDGTGIPADELELALERHATNKLAPDGPIEKIATLGFRGEALASIASVSQLRLRSRRPGAEVASGIVVEGGVIRGRFEAGRAVGTTVEVEELFFNTPARRKFLHAPASEQLEVLRTLERVYLARPTTSITLASPSAELASYPATRDLLDASARVLGPELLRQSFPIDDELPGGGRVRGILGGPALAASNSRRLYLSVNGRSIDSRPLAQGVRFAFHDYIGRTRFPIGVLHLELPGEHVDVNVHPTKREVRFAREPELAESLRRSVRRALLSSPSLAEVPEPIRPFVRPGPFAASGTAAEPIPSRRRLATAAGAQLRLAEPGPGRELASRRGRPSFRLLGCLDLLYWIGTTEAGLVLVDQHAASERLLYDGLLRDGTLARQELLEPTSLTLTPSQRQSLAVHAETLASAGFDIEPFGAGVYRLRSVPVFLGRRARAAAAGELLDELAAGSRPTVPDGMAERTAASVACHAAIRAGDAISPEEMGRVLDSLYERSEAVYSCPHGRPILFEVPRGRLDRWFLRSGP